MERKFLESLKVGEENLTKEVIDSIMSEYGKSFKTKDEEISTLKTTNESLKNQLTENSKEIEKFKNLNVDEIKKSVDDWKVKYETDTEKLNKEIQTQKYDFKIKEITNGLKFSSVGAKKSFINDLKAKELKLEEDKILGFDDFVNSYKESDPNAFINEDFKKNEVKVNTGDGHGETSKNEINSLRDALQEKYSK